MLTNEADKDVVSVAFFSTEMGAKIMVDGEVSLMIGLRRLVEDSDDYVHRAEHKRLIDRCIRAIESNPLSLGESYPDECWLWCVPMALTSIKIYDVLEGTDHSELFARFDRHAGK